MKALPIASKGTDRVSQYPSNTSTCPGTVYHRFWKPSKGLDQASKGQDVISKALGKASKTLDVISKALELTSKALEQPFKGPANLYRPSKRWVNVRLRLQQHILFNFTQGIVKNPFLPMYRKINFLSFACLVAVFANAQNTKLAAPPVSRPVYNFKKINSKLQYVFIEDKPGKVHPQEGDDVMMRMIAICNNRFMYSSAQLNKGKPGAFSISKANFEGDIADALLLMTPGDSIICMADAKSVFDYAKKPMPDYIKPGDKVQYNIRLVSIKPKVELQKEREAALAKFIQDSMQIANAGKPADNDDILLTEYFKNNHINPIKTTSGLYYSIQKEGGGALAKPGDNVVMNYTGRLIDGTVFDSNIDAAFGHVQPLSFVLGTGRVIKGWDEGIGFLKPEAKATFYIPASLAYGSQSRPGNAANAKGIPANSVLIFDVELVSARR